MYNFSKLIIILLLFAYPYYASAQPPKYMKDFVPLNNFEELDFEINPNFPKNDSFVTPNICGTLGAKIVENYNRRVEYFREQATRSASNSLIGEKGVRVWQIFCYDNQKHPEQFVVKLAIGNDDQIKKDPLNKKRQAFPQITTIFDENLNITGWAISGIEVVRPKKK